MDKRKPNGLGNPSSSRKKVVKNEYYYEYKKKNLIKRSIATTGVVIVLGVCWYIKEVPVKAEMTINNSTIEWIPQKDNLKGITFQVSKDGEIVHETTKLKYIDKAQKDTGAPNDISEINTYRNVKSLKILWKEPTDTGSNNIYQVFALNKFGRKVFKTEEVAGGFVSGIEKYIIRFNGEEFETTKPEFIINCDDIKKGKYTIDIKSIDKAGNESEFKTFAFDIETIDFEFKNGKLIPNDYKYTNKDYNFYIIDEETANSEKDIPQYDKQMFLVNEDLFNILDSGFKPKMTTPSYVIKNKEINFSWQSPLGNTKSYSFYVEAVNKETLEKSYSDLQKISGSSKMLGYHYALNTSSSYTVKSTDKYTSENSLSIDISNLDKGKKYYFHIATMDNSGIISDTKTIGINLKVSNSLENKKDTIRKFVYKTKNATNDDYRKVVDAIANNFTTDNIKSLNKSGIKIYLIKEDFKEYLKETYNIEAKAEDCVKNNKSLYFNINKSTDSLISTLSSIVE